MNRIKAKIDRKHGFGDTYLEIRLMFSVEVRLMGTPSKLYEFLEDNRADARNLAEEIGRQGFWLEDSDPPILIPPSQIELVQIFPLEQPLPKRKGKMRARDRKKIG